MFANIKPYDEIAMLSHVETRRIQEQARKDKLLEEKRLYKLAYDVALTEACSLYLQDLAKAVEDATEIVQQTGKPTQVAFSIRDTVMTADGYYALAPVKIYDTNNGIQIPLDKCHYGTIVNGDWTQREWTLPIPRPFIQAQKELMAKGYKLVEVVDRENKESPQIFVAPLTLALDTDNIQLWHGYNKLPDTS